MRRTVRVWVRGGLGNQLHSLAAAYYLAVVCGRGHRVVVDGGVVAASLDESRKFQLEGILLDLGGIDVVQSNPNSRIGSIPSRSRRKLITINKNLGRWLGYHWSPSLGHSLLDPKTAARVRMLDGHYECAELPLAAAEAGFARKVDLRQPSREVIELLEDIQPTDLAVHVRFGDFRTHADGAFLLPRKYYSLAIERATALRSIGRIRVFSDEPGAAVEFLSPIIPPEQQLVCSKDLSTVEDFVAISKHAAIVASRSSFSWWASFLSSAPVVVGPNGTDRFVEMSAREGWLLV